MIFRKPSTMFGLPIRRFLLSVVSLKCSIGASLAMRWTQPSETPARRLQEIIWCSCIAKPFADPTVSLQPSAFRI